jgi:hypothetical protein
MEAALAIELRKLNVSGSSKFNAHISQRQKITQLGDGSNIPLAA